MGKGPPRPNKTIIGFKNCLIFGLLTWAVLLGIALLYLKSC